MALADNHIAQSEQTLLTSFAKKYGISDKEVKLAFSESSQIKFIIPKTLKGKLEQIFQLVLMMLADGKVLPEEQEFCVACCRKFHLHDHVATDMLNYVQIAEAEGHDGYQAFEFILSKFSSVRT